jgi:hypothetical protein
MDCQGQYKRIGKSDEFYIITITYTFLKYFKYLDEKLFNYILKDNR